METEIVHEYIQLFQLISQKTLPGSGIGIIKCHQFSWFSLPIYVFENFLNKTNKTKKVS